MNKIRKYEELTLKDNFMFGIIMRNPKYCKTFLETILGVKIKRIEYPESQKTIDISLPAKSVRLDIYVEDDKNTVYNIEMQTSSNENIPKRSRYYQGMIDLNILDKGGDYSELKKSFVIFVCTFDLFGKGTADDVSSDMKALLNYIDGQLPSDKYTNELEAAVESARLNKNWRRDFMTLEMLYNEKLQEGLREGIAEGRKEGLQEGRKEGASEKAEQIAAALLSNGKLSTAEIAECSGLTIAQVENLRKQQ